MTEPGPWSPLPPAPPSPPAGGGWYGTPVGPPPGGWVPPPPGAPKPPRDGAPWLTVIIIAVAAAVLGGAIGGLIVRQHGKTTTAEVQGGGTVRIGATNGGRTVTNRAPGSIAAVAAKIVPSVVSIEVKTNSGGDTGSGIVLNKLGYIMTNNHVIAASKTSGSVLSSIPQ